MYNPRWPHTLVAWRDSLDENGLPVTDEEGNPTGESVVFEVVRYGTGYAPRKRACGCFETERTEKLPWGYRTSTGGIRDSGEVFQADYKISCPMIMTPLEYGVRLRLTDYTHTFEAVVKKATTYNWGTNLWIDKIGNDGGVSG